MNMNYEKSVTSVREDVQKLSQNKQSRTNLKIEMLEKEMIVLNYEVNQLNNNMNKTELKLDEITMKASTESKKKEDEPEAGFSCKICDYKSKKEGTPMKHNNTKHPNGSFKCDKCGQTFISNDTLESHIKINHIDDHENQIGSSSESSDSIANVK